MYKVVDTFNGWESDKVHNSVEEAEQELEKDRDEFFDNMVNRNCRYCKTVVPADYSYTWNGYEYEWM